MMRLFQINLGTFNSIFLTCLLLFAFLCKPNSTRGESDWFQKVKNFFGGDDNNEGEQRSLSMNDIAAGLKEALSVGATNVVSQLGQLDGFNADPSIRIPLPDNFKTVQSALSKVGMSSMLDDLELRLNRAAETATPKAKELFLDSIKELTLTDVMDIYKGPHDAATKFFRAKMSEPLANTMRPIVQNSLSEVGAVEMYNKVMGKYRSLPFVPDVNSDLTQYVIDMGLDGIFHYLAVEEAAIRQNPTKRTTDLLKRVFETR